jgi:imidazoleglycerol-phosphate dehydratase
LPLGLEVLGSSPTSASARRETRETLVEVSVDDGPRRECRISTGYEFLDHMVEMLSFYARLNIDAKVEAKRRLAHTVAEDLGITLGAALKAMMDKRIEEWGCRCHGYAQAVLDEAWSQARISYEGRSLSLVTRNTARFGQVEDIGEEFLKAFIDGLAQGMRSTIHLDLMGGEDPHHVWESGFRALGAALRQALERDPWAMGSVAGVKGTPD